VTRDIWSPTGHLLVGALTAGLLLQAGCGDTHVVDPPPTGPDSVALVPGESYWGMNRYIEYIAGDLPIILSASHGGDLEPTGIPDRTPARCGGSATTVTDRNTRELTLDLGAALRQRFDGYPHIVINHLHRRKLDANRDLEEAACGNAAVRQAWEDFHRFLEVARAAVVRDHGRGWFMDIHGHGHDIQRLELGYLLGRNDLNQGDEALASDDGYRRRSSIQTLAGYSGEGFPLVLRGESSLGALYAARGFPAVPSPTDPAPGEDPYFTGGYNTVRYGCADSADRFGGVPGGPLCGVQVEANFSGVRDTVENRARFAAATAAVLEAYLATHWAIDLVPAPAR
jgi:hypothetical protein